MLLPVATCPGCAGEAEEEGFEDEYQLEDVEVRGGGGGEGHCAYRLRWQQGTVAALLTTRRL